MAAYEYTAIDKAGKKSSGMLEADSERQVRQQLRDRKLIPASITPIKEKTSKDSLLSKFSFQKQASHADLALLTRQLATLISSGMPIIDAIKACSEQTDKKHIQSTLLALRSKVAEGHSLAASMGDFPGFFPDIYRASIAAGENSGYLDNILNRLADYTEQQAQLKQKVSQALIYPIVMLTTSILVVAALLVFVVPKLVGIFEENQATLPTITVILLAVSSGLENYGIYMLIGIMLFIISIKHILKKPAIQKRYHFFLLRLPLIGNSLRVLNTGRYASTFKILVQASVSAVDAMRAASQVVRIIPIKEALYNAAESVKEGKTIHVALKNAGYFPPLSLHLIASGEAGSKLEDMLDRVATYQEQQISGLIDTTLKLFEPILLIVMGIIVLFIVLAILLPILELQQHITF